MTRFTFWTAVFVFSFFIMGISHSFAQSFGNADFIAPKQDPAAPAAANAPAADKRNIKYNQIYNNKQEALKQEKDYILFFYRDFKINRTPSGRTMCDLRISVLSNIKNKISNVSIKLKWPAITTSASFYDVEPNVENYRDITLVGDGCYTMDKTPNIIVNRCRIKEMSAEDCASKISWVRVAE